MKMPRPSISTGNFTASSAGALATAQSLLAGLSGPVTKKYALTWLQSTDPRVDGGHYSQNLVTASAVPLPAGGLLLAAAMGVWRPCVAGKTAPEKLSLKVCP